MNHSKQSVAVAQRVCGEILTNARQLTRAHRLHSNELGNAIIRSEIVDGLDYLSYLGTMYAYFRGGMSYKLMSSGYMGNTAIVKTSLVRTDDPTYDSNSTFHVTTPFQAPVHEVMVPYYAQTRKVVCYEDLDLTASLKRLPALKVETGPEYTYDLYKGAKDDFSFGCLIGPNRFMYTYTRSFNWTSATLPEHYRTAIENSWRNTYTSHVICYAPTQAQDMAMCHKWIDKYLTGNQGKPLPPFQEWRDGFDPWYLGQATCPPTNP